MKPNTIVTIGWRNVGDSASTPTYHSGPWVDVFMEMFAAVSKQSMAKRFELVICRSESDAQRALTERAAPRFESGSDGLREMMERMAAEMGGIES